MMTETNVDLKQLLEDAIDMADTYNEVRLYENYSGRGMYGATCLGIVGSESDMLRVLITANRLDPSLFDETELDNPTKDNMGLDYIWYWPEGG